MADLRLQDRLQPALLDRLKKVEGGDRTVMSIQELRNAVIRDLEWLLNTTSMDAFQELDRHPHAARSVINFGMPDLTGCTGVDRRAFAKRIRQAILDFEPRLLRRSVKVRALDRDDDFSGNSLDFRIEAELWAEPVPIHLMLKTQINLDSGAAEVTESSGDD